MIVKYLLTAGIIGFVKLLSICHCSKDSPRSSPHHQAYIVAGGAKECLFLFHCLYLEDTNEDDGKDQVTS